MRAARLEEVIVATKSAVGLVGLDVVEGEDGDVALRRLDKRGAEVDAAGQSAAGVDAAGQENADDTVDDSASIQIILEPRMIEKNSVRVLGR